MAGGRVNWSRISNRDRMRKQGVEDVKGKTPLIDLASKARHKLSKAELRDRQHSLLGAKARQPKTSSVRSGDARDAPDFYCAISDACHRTPYSRQIRFTY